MNESKIMTIILRRMFSKKYFKPLAGIRSRMQLIKQDEQNVDIENFDSEDLSEFEADFMNVGESHKIHEREMQKNKEHLKQQIVNQKYFTENEPRFLTFAERQLICKLYKSNPEEWTVEKLSESFPALPETIQKIVHANWMPESVERIMQYDDVAIENWKKFRIGKLPVSPRFNEHLKKFKNRKIILTDRELLAKQFVVPKPKFKKPKSQLFSNIIQSYASEKQDNEKLLLQENNSHKMEDVFAHSNKNQNLLIADNKIENNSHKMEDVFAHSNKNQNLLIADNKIENNSHKMEDVFAHSNKNQNLLIADNKIKNNSHKMEDVFAHSNKNQNLLIADNKTENNSIDVKNPKKFMLKEEQYLILNSDTESKKHDIFNKKNNSKKLFTFDEFVKTKLEDIQKKSPKEGITLLNLYRKQMDASQEIKTASNDAIINMEKDTLKIVQKSNQSVSEISKNKDDDNIAIADDNLVDTSIKIWSKKIDTECNYAKPIKISKNLYKPGMTYRINDCYYDDDGEFLYRIPSVQT